jgi:hypothetical protein
MPRGWAHVVKRIGNRNERNEQEETREAVKGPSSRVGIISPPCSHPYHSILAN